MTEQTEREDRQGMGFCGLDGSISLSTEETSNRGVTLSPLETPHLAGGEAENTPDFPSHRIRQGHPIYDPRSQTVAAFHSS